MKHDAKIGAALLLYTKPTCISRGWRAAAAPLFLLTPLAAAMCATVAKASTIVTVGLAVSPRTVTTGAPVTVTWNAQNAMTCQAGGAWSGALYINGQEINTPPVPGENTYATITCAGASGTATASKPCWLQQHRRRRQPRHRRRRRRRHRHQHRRQRRHRRRHQRRHRHRHRHRRRRRRQRRTQTRHRYRRRQTSRRHRSAS